MDTIIRKATIIHEGSEFHLQTLDILVRNGVITEIGQDIIAPNAHLISGSDLYCCIGLCDIGTHTGEPGYEHRETMDSLTQSAKNGGYTALAIFPNTKPVIQTKADIKFAKDHAHCNGVHIFPIGALSKDIKGADIAEYIDMASAGAVAFSDGMQSVQDAGLISRALQYAKQVDGIIIHHPENHDLSQGGEMHEGHMSTSLGLKGIPDIAELHVIQRDILLNGYNESHLIEHCVSAERSVSAIRVAKKDQSTLSSTVAYMNLLFTDEDMHDFDTNLRVVPVLRSQEDKKALIKGLKDGTIDAIVSNHTPLDEEAKNLEFTYATPGATGLETCLIACITALRNELGIETIVHKMTIEPRKLLQIPIPNIAVGQKADLCIFDVNSTNVYDAASVKSKSSNNPFKGSTFTTKILATIVS